MGNNNDKPERIVENLNNKSEVRKSRALLFAQTTPSNLPVPAQRLFLAMLANIDESTTDEDNVFIIKGKDIADLAGMSPNVIGQQLKDMSIKADSLRQYTLEIKEDDGNYLRTGLISSTKYLKGQRAIRISVDKFLMPYLRKMREQFVISYAAAGPMKFKSEYTIRLFEMMNYYLDEGSHYFTVEETRTMFNIPDGKIKLVSTLNQKVIKPSMEDINNYTNLEVSVKHETHGRKIIGYHFFVKPKQAILSNQEQQKIKDEEFINMLVSPPYNFNGSSLVKLIDKYGLESIRNNFEYTKAHNPANFPAYLHWAITKQAYEKEKEIEEIRAVNSSLMNDIVPAPAYNNKQKNNVPEIEKPVPIDYDELKVKNPQLYEIMMRINNKVKNQGSEE